MVETAEQLALRAARCLQENRVAEGIDAYRLLLEMRPNLPDSWYNIAYLQRQSGRFEDALESYQRALDYGVSAPEEVHLNRAAIMSEYLEQAHDAARELKRALAINPRFTPAWLNLGNLYEDWGDSTEARTAYASALQIVPTNGRALARLAAIDTFEGKASFAASRLRKAVRNPGLAIDDKAEIAFALGNALDALGEYDEAFATFVEANEASRASAPPPGVRYDAAAQERLVDELIRLFPNGASDVRRSGLKPPIFLCGMFRSGSTLAEQILARHSRVTAGGEFEFLPTLIHTFLQPYPTVLGSASPQSIEDVRDRYLAQIRGIHPQADVITDKRPDNFLHIGLIKTLFPDAKIVHTKRNPLDNILSVYFLHFQHNISYGLNLSDIAHWYVQYRKLMEHWKSIYPEDIHDLDYDELVATPEPATASMLRFCALEWEDACLSKTAARNPVRTASVWQVRQPLHTRSSGRWRNYAAHLGAVQEALELP
jgi:tetratricopeptide (TPR) repeat protein